MMTKQIPVTCFGLLQNICDLVTLLGVDLQKEVRRKVVFHFKSFYLFEFSDVYSFAIICREVITQMGPYEPTSDINGAEFRRNLDPDQILDKVRMGGVPPFRPELNATDCFESPELLALTRDCWAENPNERPD